MGLDSPIEKDPIHNWQELGKDKVLSITLKLGPLIL